MQVTEKPAFAQLLTDVLAYYKSDASPFVLGLWWNALQGFDFDQVSQAMTRHATDPERGQFAPKVADVVRILSGTHTDRAQLAWGKALDAAARVGAYTDVAFDDPAIHAAIEDLGGWPKFCRTETKDLSYLQHRFCESHRAYTGRGQFDFPKCLHGERSTDDVWLKRGLTPPKPTLIGDPKAALLVFENGTQGGKLRITHAANAVAQALQLEVA